MKLLKVIALATIALSTVAHAETQPEHTVGVHLFSQHSKATYREDGVSKNYNNQNYGLYYRHSSGATVGTYHNSYRDQTSYLGWTWHVGTVYGASFDVSTVAMYGYKDHMGSKSDWMPGVMPSVALPAIAGYRARIAGIPALGKNGVGLVHLMLEKSL